MQVVDPLNPLPGVVATLAKNVKTCVLRLSPTKVCFVISERGPAGGTYIWCELSQVGQGISM